MVLIGVLSCTKEVGIVAVQTSVAILVVSCSASNLRAASFTSASCCLRRDYEYHKLLIVDCLIVDC